MNQQTHGRGKRGSPKEPIFTRPLDACPAAFVFLSGRWSLKPKVPRSKQQRVEGPAKGIFQHLMVAPCREVNDGLGKHRSWSFSDAVGIEGFRCD